MRFTQNILGYAIKGKACRDIENPEDGLTMFDDGEDVLIFQVPRSDVIMIHAISPKEIDVKGKQVLVMPVIGFQRSGLLSDDSDLIDDFGFYNLGVLRRGEIREYVNDDELMDSISDLYNSMCSTNPFV